MEITYLGHSAFRMRGKEVTIVTDPYSADLGMSMGKPSADIVTVSHKSANHSYMKGVLGDPRVIQGPGEYEVRHVLIAGVATSTQPRKGPLNTAYVLRFDELAVCHLGDVSSKLTNQQIEEIGSIDVLMVPVGGNPVLDASGASQVIAQLEPTVIVPMHYPLQGSQSKSTQTVEHFCREMGIKEWTAEPKLTVTRGSLGHEVRVIVLENKRI